MLSNSNPCTSSVSYFTSLGPTVLLSSDPDVTACRRTSPSYRAPEMVEMFLVQEIGEKPDCWVRSFLACCGASPPSYAHYAQTELLPPTFTAALGPTSLAGTRLRAIRCRLLCASVRKRRQASYHHRPVTSYRERLCLCSVYSSLK